MLGEQSIELVATKSALRIFAPANSTAFQHFAIVVSDIDKAMQKLSGCQGWSPISRAGPQALPLASGGVTAFKFRDPEGHPLELLWFPDGTRPPAWSNSRQGRFSASIIPQSPSRIRHGRSRSIESLDFSF